MIQSICHVLWLVWKGNLFSKHSLIYTLQFVKKKTLYLFSILGHKFWKYEVYYLWSRARYSLHSVNIHQMCLISRVDMTSGLQQIRHPPQQWVEHQENVSSIFREVLLENVWCKPPEAAPCFNRAHSFRIISPYCQIWPWHGEPPAYVNWILKPQAWTLSREVGHCFFICWTSVPLKSLWRKIKVSKAQMWRR